MRNVETIEARVRRFRLTIDDRFRGVLATHLFEISAEFPSAIFLLETEIASFSRREVIRAGRTVQEIQRRNREIQDARWEVLNIFAPFRAEHRANLAFGSLWGPWLDDLAASLETLKSNSNAPLTSPKVRDGELQADARVSVKSKRKSPAKRYFRSSQLRSPSGKRPSRNATRRLSGVN